MLFKRKKKIKYPKVWAMVDYSDQAKELCVGGTINLRIYLYQGNKLVDTMMYSDGRLKLLREQGIPVVVKAKYDIPAKCFEIPKRKVLFGRIRW